MMSKIPSRMKFYEEIQYATLDGYRHIDPVIDLQTVVCCHATACTTEPSKSP